MEGRGPALEGIPEGRRVHSRGLGDDRIRSHGGCGKRRKRYEKRKRNGTWKTWVWGTALGCQISRENQKRNIIIHDTHKKLAIAGYPIPDGNACMFRSMFFLGEFFLREKKCRTQLVGFEGRIHLK